MFNLNLQLQKAIYNFPMAPPLQNSPSMMMVGVFVAINYYLESTDNSTKRRNRYEPGKAPIAI